MIYTASAVLLHIFGDCTTQRSGREWILSLKLFSPCGTFPFTFIVQKSSCWSKRAVFTSLLESPATSQAEVNLQETEIMSFTVWSRELRGGRTWLQVLSHKCVLPTPHTCPQMQSLKCPCSPGVLVHSDPDMQTTKPGGGRVLAEAAGIVCFLQARRICGKRMDERKNVQKKDSAGFGWDSLFSSL